MMLDLRLSHLNVIISLIKIIIITFEFYTWENDKLPRIPRFVKKMILDHFKSPNYFLKFDPFAGVV